MVMEKGQLHRALGDYILVRDHRENRDKTKPFVVLSSRDPNYQFPVEGIFEHGFVSGDYLVSSRDAVIVADLKKKTITKIPDPSEEKKPRKGWTMITGDHHMLRIADPRDQKIGHHDRGLNVSGGHLCGHNFIFFEKVR